jgi:hypothetical protein
MLVSSNYEDSKQGLAFPFPLGAFQLHMPHQQHQLQKVHQAPQVSMVLLFTQIQLKYIGLRVD